jgi:chromosome segregation ATPase
VGQGYRERVSTTSQPSNADLLSAIQGVATNVTELKGTVDGHTAVLNQHTTALTELKGTVDGHTAVLNQHTTDLTDLKGTVDGHTAVLNQHTTALTELKGTVDGHTAVLNRHTTDLTDLHRVVTAHSGILTELNSTVREQGTVLSRVANDQRVMRGDLTELRSDVGALRTDLGALRDEVREGFVEMKVRFVYTDAHIEDLHKAVKKHCADPMLHPKQPPTNTF